MTRTRRRNRKKGFSNWIRGVYASERALAQMAEDEEYDVPIVLLQHAPDGSLFIETDDPPTAESDFDHRHEMELFGWYLRRHHESWRGADRAAARKRYRPPPELVDLVPEFKSPQPRPPSPPKPPAPPAFNNNAFERWLDNLLGSVPYGMPK